MKEKEMLHDLESKEKGGEGMCTRKRRKETEKRHVCGKKYVSKEGGGEGHKRNMNKGRRGWEQGDNRE